VENVAAVSIIDNIKDFSSNLTWKSAVIIAIPVALYIYPKPLVKIFLPLIDLVSKYHGSFKRKHNVREIILTTNEALNLANLKNLVITKGMAPQVDNFNKKECLTLEVFRSSNRANSYLFASQT
jgi:hypothetical protein